MYLKSIIIEFNWRCCNVRLGLARRSIDADSIVLDFVVVDIRWRLFLIRLGYRWLSGARYWVFPVSPHFMWYCFNSFQ